MIRYFFVFLVVIHGSIHIIGFNKAFGFGKPKKLTKNISKIEGIIWLLTTLLFLISSFLYLSKICWWWYVCLVPLFLSQLLIFFNWNDTKFGTISNLIILPVVLVGYFSWDFNNSYYEDAAKGFKENQSIPKIITENDLQSLPPVVQKYLRFVNIVNKPQVLNFRCSFEGEMRGKNQKWFKFNTDQINFIENPSRLFFMKSIIHGLPTTGYHRFFDGIASMNIKLFSHFPIVSISNDTLNQSETVTYFNDMCLMAPATLIDKRITWRLSGNRFANATFTHNGITVAAVLYFNENGQLVNFVSNDRYDVSDGESKKYKFSTPVYSYQESNGTKSIEYGVAIWHYPEGDFVYGKFHLKNIIYNIKTY